MSAYSKARVKLVNCDGASRWKCCSDHGAESETRSQWRIWRGEAGSGVGEAIRGCRLAADGDDRGQARNLTQDSIVKPTDSDFGAARRYEHVVFWPTIDATGSGTTGTDIPVHAFEDWPDNDMVGEIPFLKERLKWKNPKILGGIVSPGNAKPDFVMYSDADDELPPINAIDMNIRDLLPGYEIGKVSSLRRGLPIRGACVLMYKPTKSTTTFIGGGSASRTDSSLPPERDRLRGTKVESFPPAAA